MLKEHIGNRWCR